MPKFAANLSMLFTELPFLDRFAAAADAGFEGAEFLFPYEFDALAIAERLTANGLTQVLFNMRPGDWNNGERGIAALPGREDEFRAGLPSVLQYASALSCQQVHCMAGIIPADLRAAEIRETYVANLRYAAKAFADAGIGLLIEPINTRDMPGYYLTGTRQALDIIAEVAAPNLAVQFDCYHMHIMEDGLAETLSAHLPQIAHVQVADAPGRHEPGTGDIDYPMLFRHLDAIGYRGWVGCEYRPKAGTLEGLGWMRNIG